MCNNNNTHSQAKTRRDIHHKQLPFSLHTHTPLRFTIIIHFTIPPPPNLIPSQRNHSKQLYYVVSCCKDKRLKTNVRFYYYLWFVFCVNSIAYCAINIFFRKEHFKQSSDYARCIPKMTLAEFIGCTFLAFGPPLAMFLFTIVHDPIRIIILISAAFFWLVSLLASALLWYIVVPLRVYTVYGLVASVFIQVIWFWYQVWDYWKEMCNFGIVILYRRQLDTWSTRCFARLKPDCKKWQTVRALSRINTSWPTFRDLDSVWWAEHLLLLIHSLMR